MAFLTPARKHAQLLRAKHNSQGRRRKMLKLITTGAIAAACLAFSATLAAAESPKFQFLKSNARAVEGKATRTSLKLLKSVFKDGATTNEGGDAIPAGQAFGLPGSSTIVKCPKDTRCLIELTVNLNYGASAGAQVVPVWTVGESAVEAGGIEYPSVNTQGTTTWTFSKNVGPGSHEVIAGIGCLQDTCIYVSHSLVVRLYKR
jgi:hypothetical protein